MKLEVKFVIGLLFFASVGVLLSGCAHKPIQCQEIAFTGGPEIDEALVEKCRHEKSEAVQRAIKGYDRLKGKAVDKIEKI